MRRSLVYMEEMKVNMFPKSMAKVAIGGVNTKHKGGRKGRVLDENHFWDIFLEVEDMVV